jgi:hypothetical protein
LNCIRFGLHRIVKNAKLKYDDRNSIDSHSQDEIDHNDECEVATNDDREWISHGKLQSFVNDFKLKDGFKEMNDFNISVLLSLLMRNPVERITSHQLLKVVEDSNASILPYGTIQYELYKDTPPLIIRQKHVDTRIPNLNDWDLSYFMNQWSFIDLPLMQVNNESILHGKMNVIKEARQIYAKQYQDKQINEDTYETLLMAIELFDKSIIANKQVRARPLFICDVQTASISNEASPNINTTINDVENKIESPSFDQRVCDFKMCLVIATKLILRRDTNDRYIGSIQANNTFQDDSDSFHRIILSNNGVLDAASIYSALAWTLQKSMQRYINLSKLSADFWTRVLSFSIWLTQCWYLSGRIELFASDLNDAGYEETCKNINIPLLLRYLDMINYISLKRTLGIELPELNAVVLYIEGRSYEEDSVIIDARCKRFLDSLLIADDEIQMEFDRILKRWKCIKLR